MPELLKIDTVNRRFGGLEALGGVSFGVREGEIVGVIGPNGAGKTTLFNVITGVFPPSFGRIFFKGEDISRMKPHKVARKGIVRTFQADILFKELTVIQNVLIGLHMRSTGFDAGRILLSPSLFPVEEMRMARDVLETVDLITLKDSPAGDLPHGHQRILGIAVALATDPTLLLLDEPVTGMNLDEIRAVTGLIRKLNERGLTILLVEHNIKTVMDICQRIVVLNFGKKIAEGCPEEIRSNKDVIEAYLGPDST